MSMKRTNSRGQRIQDSAVVALVGDLLRRNARTKTVTRLTGCSEIVIRDIYWEIMGTGPTRGPSPHSPNHYIAKPLNQWDSSLAASVLLNQLHQYRVAKERSSRTMPLLGRYYVDAYDIYCSLVNTLALFDEPMEFERFHRLGAEVENQRLLIPRTCSRCESVFVTGDGPQYAGKSLCGLCKINSRRECGGCGQYVPLDDGDIPPERQPKCLACGEKSGRKAHQRARDRVESRMERARYREASITDLVEEHGSPGDTRVHLPESGKGVDALSAL